MNYVILNQDYLFEIAKKLLNSPGIIDFSKVLKDYLDEIYLDKNKKKILGLSRLAFCKCFKTENNLDNDKTDTNRGRIIAALNQILTESEKNSLPTIDNELFKPNSDVLKELIQTLRKRSNFSIDNLLRDCIYDQMDRYWNKSIPRLNDNTKVHLDTLAKTKTITDFNNNKAKFYIDNGIHYTSINQQNFDINIRKIIKLCIPHKEETSPDQTDYIKIFTFVIYEIFVGKNINFPNYNGSEVLSIHNLYNALTDRIDNNFKFETEWNRIYKSKNQLCNYLFDIDYRDLDSPDDFTAIKHICSDWKCINKINLKKNNGLYIEAKRIIELAFTHPLYQYLITNNPVKHRPEVLSILKRVITEKTEVLPPPVISVLNWINEIAENESREADGLFTSTNFLHFIGFIAGKVCNNEYLLNDNEMECYRKEYCEKHSDLYGVNIDEVILAIETSFKTSKLSDHSANGFRFKIKPFRLVCAAIYQASSATISRDLNGFVENLEMHFPKNDNFEDRIRLDSSNFHDNHDSYCFFGLGVLYNLDSQLKQQAIQRFLKSVSDFSVKNREKQICYLYLLSGILASKISLSNKQREEIFVFTYGKTMYNFQSTYWDYLIKESFFFEQYVESSIKESCTLNNNKAIGQPLFYFAYGLMCEKNNNAKKKTLRSQNKLSLSEKEKAENFLFYSSLLQCRTWYAKQEYYVNDLILEINNGFKDAHSVMFEKESDAQSFKLKPLAEYSLYYIYGVQLLAYATANILRYKSELECVFKNDGDLKKAIQVVVASDYYMRKTNKKYTKDIENGCLLCGSYRFTCLVNPEEIIHKELMQLKTIEVEYSEEESLNLMDDYNKWLNYELKCDNKRYAFLMCCLLSHTNFFNTGKNKKDRKQKILNIINEDKTTKYLDYDRFEINKKLIFG